MKRYQRNRPGFALLASLCLFMGGTTRILEAQETSALFWSISLAGEPAGYLLGTIHSEDPRVLDFQETFIQELASNDFFAMEIVPDLPTLSRLTQYMQYEDGTTLESQIGPARYEKLRHLLARYRIPDDWMPRMKVWAAMITMSVPPPQTGLFMDFSLSLRAAGAGLKVVGLETLEQQLSFLEAMPLEQQLALLDQSMEDHQKSIEIHAEMVERYLDGDMRTLQAKADEQLNQLDADTRQLFIDGGIHQRNQRMLSSLLDLLQEGKVFVAVGALHLPGESGLVNLLRGRGFVLEPLPLPLNGVTPASAPGSQQ